MNEQENKRKTESESMPNQTASAPENAELLKKKKKINTGIMLLSLAVLLLIGVVAYIIANNQTIGTFVNMIGDVLTPLVIGLILAYLANPLLRFFEYVVFRKLIRKHPNLCRGLSLLMTAISILLILFLVLMLIIPELVSSFRDFFSNWGLYVDSSVSYVNNKVNGIMQSFDQNAQTKEYLNAREIKHYINNLMNGSENFFESIAGKLLGVDSVGDLVGKGFSVLSSVVGILADLLLGVIIGFYLLASKEKRSAQIMKLRTAYFSEKTNRRISEITSMVNKSFGGYIRASLFDSVLVAVETYIIFQIFGISDYNILLAAFIGITNIIPILGPFIGAVPTGAIVLITNPSKIWLFILLVIVIQQIDGNIICPHIVGNNIGVSPLCVVTAITVMGGLFGIVGMVIAVPTFAVIITLVKDSAERRLAAKGCSIELGDYYAKDTLVSAEEDLKKHKALILKFGERMEKLFFKIFRRKKNKAPRVQKKENKEKNESEENKHESK